MVTRVMMIAAAMRTVWLFNAAAKLRRMALRLRRVTKEQQEVAFHLSGSATRGAGGSAAAVAYQLRGSGSIKMVRRVISLTKTPKMR